jgi:hypothetical protein
MPWWLVVLMNCCGTNHPGRRWIFRRRNIRMNLDWAKLVSRSQTHVMGSFYNLVCHHQHFDLGTFETHTRVGVNPVDVSTPLTRWPRSRIDHLAPQAGAAKYITEYPTPPRFVQTTGFGAELPLWQQWRKFNTIYAVEGSGVHGIYNYKPTIKPPCSCRPGFPTPLPMSTSYQGPRRKLVLAFDVGTTYSGISYW